jgi:glutamate 5-kinase
VVSARLSSARRIVVKIGSALLMGEDGRAHARWLATLADDIAALGKETLIVSSGAIALGCHALGLSGRLRL